MLQLLCGSDTVRILGNRPKNSGDSTVKAMKATTLVWPCKSQTNNFCWVLKRKSLVFVPFPVSRLQGCGCSLMCLFFFLRERSSNMSVLHMHIHDTRLLKHLSPEHNLSTECCVSYMYGHIIAGLRERPLILTLCIGDSRLSSEKQSGKLIILLKIS